MKASDPNYAVHCTVEGCKYHAGDKNYCSLESIRVGSHEKHPTDESCVDCKSFACRSEQSCQ